MHEPTDSLADTLANLVDAKLLHVFTSVPARVISVDLSRNEVDVQPLLRNRETDNTQTTPAPIYNVPFQILSADTGRFKITMPIREGDTVLLVYSQRDRTFFYNSDGKTVVDTFDIQAHQNNPVMCIPCMFTATNPTEVMDNALVLQSGNSRAVFSENGDIELRGRNVNIQSNTLTHNGTDISDQHRHGNVESGPSTSGPPV